MKYSRFELLVLFFGGGAIIGTAATTASRNSDWVEVAGQLLLLVVLFGALQWGRKGGYIAGIGATLIYFVMRVPTFATAGPFSPTLIQLTLTRAVVYGALGIVGGEIATRIKYFFVKLEDRDHIDEVTHLYNEAYIRELIRSYVGRYDRYQAVFSLVMIRIDEDRLPPLSKTPGRRLLRETGRAILGDIRLVDEMGRFDGPTFCVLLPNTPLEGARCAAARLIRTACASLKNRGIEPDGSVVAEPLGYPEDRDAISELLPPEPMTPADRRI